ncbi:MAG: hypothetical protein MI919_00905 [Holophagales bacterium]|nr:hypothetical protein [Holophagales bacterium]
MFRIENGLGTFRFKMGGSTPKHLTFRVRDIDPRYVEVRRLEAGNSFSVTIYADAEAPASIRVHRGNHSEKQSVAVVGCFPSRVAAKRFSEAFADFVRETGR